ncbi:hypothetical protein [Thalassospira lucentensis]|uniref:hypothetical protein n=1 Tax=Thalassospira lucentensis TaxID=168935 RepID=UPI0003B581E0|nr:hypothetical protein [Thalassospira lucentensis]RCK24754.1 hypothetical protein TH1_14655 [Thalassospira lucentensis MCCC 1A00383 = DSM 14000]
MELKAPRSHNDVWNFLRWISVAIVGFFFTFSIATSLSQTGYFAIITVPITYLTLFVGLILFSIYVIIIPFFGHAIQKTGTNEEAEWSWGLKLCALGIDLIHTTVFLSVVLFSSQIATQHAYLTSKQDITPTVTECVRKELSEYMPSTNGRGIWQSGINAGIAAISNDLDFGIECDSPTEHLPQKSVLNN